MAKVGWVLTIGETKVKTYCCVPPHEDTVPQSAEEGGIPTSSRERLAPCIPPTWQTPYHKWGGF